MIITYFAFTSLSTVGFGDFNPRSDYERVMIAMILMFGVAIFSYVMGNFLEILNKFQKFDETLDHGDDLSKFFGLIKNFNMGLDLKQSLKIEIEEFFDYKWINDKNQSFEVEEDTKILEQLPTDVQSRIFSDFLYS